MQPFTVIGVWLDEDGDYGDMSSYVDHVMADDWQGAEKAALERDEDRLTAKTVAIFDGHHNDVLGTGDVAEPVEA